MRSFARSHHSLVRSHGYIVRLLTNSLLRSRENVLDNVPISACYPDAASTHGYAKKPLIGVGPFVPPLARLLAHSLFCSLAHSLSPLSSENALLVNPISGGFPLPTHGHSKQRLISTAPVTGSFARQLACLLAPLPGPLVPLSKSLVRSLTRF